MKLLSDAELAEKIRRWNNMNFAVKLSVHKFAQKFLAERASSAAPTEIISTETLSSKEAKIWVYWAQGIPNMPPLVRACFEQLKFIHGEDRITFLSDENFRQYVDFPGYIYDRVFANKTFFSDLLRVNLLAKYGGVWIDATCYCSGSVDELLAKAWETGFFAFNSHDMSNFTMISNCFFISRPNGVIPTLMKEALYRYWLENSEPKDYFIFHLIFEALCNLNDEFKKSWYGAFRLSDRPLHLLQCLFLKPFDLDIWKHVTTKSPVHKLTYKYNRETAYKGTYLEYIMEKPRSFYPMPAARDPSLCEKSEVVVHFPLNGIYDDKFSVSVPIENEFESAHLKMPVPRSARGRLCISTDYVPYIIFVSFTITSCRKGDPGNEVVMERYDDDNLYAGITLSNGFVRPLYRSNKLALWSVSDHPKLYLDFDFSERLYNIANSEIEFFLSMDYMVY